MFTLKLAWRYAFSKSNRHRSATLVIMFGIAIGMLAIISVLALMNSLQTELLDQVKAIESFHVQVTFPPSDSSVVPIEDYREQLEHIEHVVQVFPYVNTQVMLQNPRADRSSTARLRVIEASVWETENPFSKRTLLWNGTIPQPLEVAISGQMAMKIGANIGDTLQMTLLGAGKTAVLAPSTVTLTISAIFQTGLPEFDNSTIISDVTPLMNIIGPKRVIYGLFLEPNVINRSQSVVSTIANEFPEATIRTWQQVNSAFYSALTLEKVMMYLFLLFMFIILAVNMKNASSRLLFVKQRELAILRALGSPKHITVQVFLLQAVIITLIGETIGIIGSFLLGTYIGPILSWIDSIQSKFSGKSNVLLSYPFTMEIQTGEVIVITCIVLALSVGFTYIGCRHLLRKEPMELMYHE